MFLDLLDGLNELDGLSGLDGLDELDGLAPASRFLIKKATYIFTFILTFICIFGFVGWLGWVGLACVVCFALLWFGLVGLGLV